MSAVALAHRMLAVVAVTLLTCACGGEHSPHSKLDGGAEPSEAEPAETDAEPPPGDACAAESCAAPARPDSGIDQLTDGIVGIACAADTACGEGRCSLSERITGVLFTDGYCTGRCREDAHCGERGYCAPGFRGSIGSCLLRCETDADCDRTGYRCRVANAIGRCMPGPEPLPEGVVGNACTGDETCGGGPSSCASSLVGVAAPGGYCSQRCSVDADCSSGGACVSGLGTAPLSIGTCFKRCDPPGGCREGYTCNALSEVDRERGGLCVPQRTSSAAGG